MHIRLPTAVSLYSKDKGRAEFVFRCVHFRKHGTFLQFLPHVIIWVYNLVSHVKVGTEYGVARRHGGKLDTVVQEGRSNERREENSVRSKFVISTHHQTTCEEMKICNLFLFG